jgi:hypothetical protein
MDPMIITVDMSGDVKLLKASSPECPGTLRFRHAVITIPRNSEIIASYGWRSMCLAKNHFWPARPQSNIKLDENGVPELHLTPASPQRSRNCKFINA